MSDLKGKLAVFEPTTVFQLLNLASATGALSVKGEHNTARVFFQKGNITFAEISNRPHKLGEILVEKNLITRDRLESALREKGKRRKLGEVLVANKAIDQAALYAAIEDQIKDVVYEVVRWREGSFEFTHGKTPAAQDIFIDIPLDHLMLEGLKRLDEEGETP